MGPTVPALPVPDILSGASLPHSVYCHPVYFAHLETVGRARWADDRNWVSVQRMFMSSLVPGGVIRHVPIWIPCKTYDLMPRVGLWDPVGFFLRHAQRPPGL